MACVLNGGLAPLPADAPAWVGELAASDRRPSPDGSVPLPDGMPPLPPPPPGCVLAWVGVYWWSDVPAPNAMCKDAHSVLWVSAWSWRKAAWRKWRRNG